MIAGARQRARTVTGLCAVTILWAGPAWSRACPSYQRGTTDGTHHCGATAHPGKDPTTAEWKAIFALVAQGPSKWGNRGMSIPPLRSGCGGSETRVPATFPCELLKALVQKESAWHQFCSPTEPVSERGKPAQTLIARDCGYGATQVTSGMREGESAPFDKERVAADAFYNATVGASILAGKWQGARCLENRDPGIVEHWYVALWKYNGYSYSNDPSNPVFSSTRGIYNPAVGGTAPYQEKVFGIIEKGAGKLWKAIALAYPRIEDVAGRKSDAVAKVECASPTDCTEKRPTHRSGCNLADADPLLETPPATDAGARPPATDAGAPATTPTAHPDAGGPPVAAGKDAGAAPAADSPGGGCGCQVAGQTWAAIPVLALGAWLLAGPRRRRRDRRVR